MEFDLLAYNGAKQKLVEWLGYPVECLELKYELNVCRRGNIIDKKRGNIIKLDQHKYVRVAEHGLTPLTSKQRKATYQEAVRSTSPFCYALSISAIEFIELYALVRILIPARTIAISTHLFLWWMHVCSRNWWT